MLKTNRNKNINEIVRAFKATVEYPFNNHDFCDETWYISLKKRGKGKRSLYNNFTGVKKITISFIIKSGIAIELIHHPLYSKNHFTTLTPNKTRQWTYMLLTTLPPPQMYGMTISLTHRVMIAVGISNLGSEKFWKIVYSRVNLTTNNETTPFLHSQETYRAYRTEYRGRKEVKKYRIQSKHN